MAARAAGISAVMQRGTSALASEEEDWEELEVERRRPHRTAWRRVALFQGAPVPNPQALD